MKLNAFLFLVPLLLSPAAWSDSLDSLPVIVSASSADTLHDAVKALTGVEGYHTAGDSTTYTTFLTSDGAVGIKYHVKMAPTTPAYMAKVGLRFSVMRNGAPRDLRMATDVRLTVRSSSANQIRILVGSDAYDSVTVAAGAALTSSDISTTTSWKRLSNDVTDFTMSTWYDSCTGDCLETGWDGTKINIGEQVKSLSIEPVLDIGWNRDGTKLVSKDTGTIYIKRIDAEGCADCGVFVLWDGASVVAAGIGDRPRHVSKLVEARMPRSFARQSSSESMTGILGLGSRDASAREDMQALDVLLSGEASRISVAIFDNLGTPVIAWDEDLSAGEVVNLPLSSDGRRVAGLVWNLRAASGRPVPAGVYLWKVTVTSADGQKIDSVYRMGVKTSR